MNMTRFILLLMVSTLLVGCGGSTLTVEVDLYLDKSSEPNGLDDRIQTMYGQAETLRNLLEQCPTQFRDAQSLIVETLSLYVQMRTAGDS
jgi:hypothetical protein